MSKSSSEVAVDATDTVSITNISDLSNVKAISQGTDIATATLTSGTISIKGVKVGTTTITVSADNADSKTINVNVKASTLRTNMVEKINLNNLKNELGTLSAIDGETILQTYLDLNKIKKFKNELEIKNITKTNALIEAFEDSEILTGEQQVNFEFKSEIELLNEAKEKLKNLNSIKNNS